MTSYQKNTIMTFCTIVNYFYVLLCTRCCLCLAFQWSIEYDLFDKSGSLTFFLAATLWIFIDDFIIRLQIKV